jgi:hypothetical protein
MAWGGLNRFTRHNLFRITPEPPHPSRATLRAHLEINLPRC